VYGSSNFFFSSSSVNFLGSSSYEIFPVILDDCKGLTNWLVFLAGFVLTPVAAVGDLVAFVARFQRISPEATCSTTVIWLIDLLGKFGFLLIKSSDGDVCSTNICVILHIGFLTGGRAIKHLQ